MQEFVFFIDGDVLHPLTIDPTVWIFDERKVDLDTYFDEVRTIQADDTSYTKAISEQWDKEMTEGSSPPPNPNSNENKIKYEKQNLIHGSFGMPLKPFLDNTEPMDDISQVLITQKDGTSQIISYQEAQTSIIGFSHKGQTLKDDGPIHLYFDNGENRENPIKNIIRFTIQKE